MPKRPHQKRRPFLLLSLLQRQSDEDHPIPLCELQAELERAGFQADRKTLYDDLETLRLQGYDIQNRWHEGYYLASRSFQLAELKLLVDAVQSSKFISARKSRQLIAKLEQLTNVHKAAQLQRQVYVTSRVKTMNEQIYYSIDALHQAIAANIRVRFRYFDYNTTKEKIYRKGGQLYEVSPYALLWDDENYYLVAYHAPSEDVRHYRVDKMDRLHAVSLPRQGAEAFASFDLGVYSKSHFGMFSGRAEQVTLRCANHFVGVILDRFGRDAFLVPDGPDRFTFTASVAVSPQFYGWLCGLGPEVNVLRPHAVRAEFLGYLEQIRALYSSWLQHQPSRSLNFSP